MQKLIEQMRAELFSGKFCISDFEDYDVININKSSEPFFWMVRRNGTTLLQIGLTMEHNLGKQNIRMEVMRNHNALISSIMYWNEECAKYFYWDGWKLHPIEKTDIPVIFKNVWGARIARLAIDFPEEYAMANKPLELRMANDKVEVKFKKVKEIARDIHDESFMDCVERLKNWRRISTNQYIEIYDDFTKNSFGFAEMLDGDSNICGGIIYHANLNDNRWQIHT